MKYLKTFSTALIILILCSINEIKAQTRIKAEDVPQKVIQAFAERYPKAVIKKWKVADDLYAADAKGEGHRFNAAFNKNGNWVMTSAKLNWSWDLPKVVQNGLKKSKYVTWEFDGIKAFDTPTGRYYQLWLDDGNLQIDAFHEGIFTQNWLIDFAPTGELIRQKNITEKVLF